MTFHAQYEDTAQLYVAGICATDVDCRFSLEWDIPGDKPEAIDIEVWAYTDTGREWVYVAPETPMGKLIHEWLDGGGKAHLHDEMNHVDRCVMERGCQPMAAE